MSRSTPDNGLRRNRPLSCQRALAAAVVVVAMVGTGLAAPGAAGTKDQAVDSATATVTVAERVSSGFDPAADLGSMYHVVDQIGARKLWDQGVTGAGIDVAVIDTGVAPVPALTGAD
ncbi:MAG: hypothetical protein WBM50_06615, partial [Acidimicrobiales bacterium]